MIWKFSNSTVKTLYGCINLFCYIIFYVLFNIWTKYIVTFYYLVIIKLINYLRKLIYLIN